MVVITKPNNAEQNGRHYVAEYDRRERNRAGQSWLDPVRKAAIAYFADQGFPTTHDEEWRYTNVAVIARTPFLPAGPPTSPVTLGAIAPFLLGETTRLVFVNGRFDANLSATNALPAEVTVSNLARRLETNPDTLRPYLARYAGFENSPFTALNTALFEDGAFIHLPRGLVLTQPVHILYVSTDNGRPAVSHPRTLIVADEASQVSVIESYVGLNGGAYFTNVVTEIVVGDGAVVDHYKLQQDGDAAFHVAAVRTHQGRDSSVSSFTVTLGGRLIRNDVHSVMDGPGGHLDLNGLYIGRGHRHIDNHLRVEHAKPHCNSREFYKGILEDQSHGVFTGRIIVHPDAQKTDAKQTNKNLLLSGEAQIDTKPQLEIFADDVKCTHGATIGQIEESELFYLRSRGIPEHDARALLIYAFAAESFSRVKIASLRQALEGLLFNGIAENHLPGEEAGIP